MGGVSTEKAYEILNLPLGAAKDAIETSYKKLANKWHPEKQHTQEALKRFKSISIAYRKLMSNERDDKDMTLYLFAEQLQNNKTILTDSNRHQHHQQQLNNNGSNNNNNKNINKNKIKLKLINNNNGSSGHSSNEDNNNDEYEQNNNNEDNENSYHNENHDEELNNKLKARSLAVKGNELAFQGQYLKAIEYFTEAIKYDISDCKFYGNRSYCYDKLSKYEEALKDAEKAILVEPAWPKGYFRKGRALCGLKNYTEAEQAYEKVLEFENLTDDSELIEELHKVRALQLQEMGFSKVQSENAIKDHHTVQAALEAILSYANDGYNSNNSDNDENDEEPNSHNSNENVYYYDHDDAGHNGNYNHNGEYVYDDDDEDVVVDGMTNEQSTHNEDGTSTSHYKTYASSAAYGTSNKKSTNGSHSHEENNKKYSGSTALWIGNVDPKLTEKKLAELFGEFGEVTTVRCLAEKYCAFVNFKHREDAGRAMQKLQGKLVEGQKLLIKYPDNPNTSMLNPTPTVTTVTTATTVPVITSTTTTTNTVKATIAAIVQKPPPQLPISQKTQIKSQVDTTTSIATKSSVNPKPSTNSNDTNNNISQQIDNSKLTGPVNGNECYFWRTTGCVYADKCRYLHVSKHKGIDKKPWHKQGTSA